MAQRGRRSAAGGIAISMPNDARRFALAIIVGTAKYGAGTQWRCDGFPMPSHSDIEDLRISGKRRLITPRALKQALAASDEVRALVATSRKQLRAIFDGRDQRLFVVVGPCSIHDPEAALEYARRLSQLNAEIGDTIMLLMRVYFEKPRTTTGWKGLVNDPDLDDSFQVEKGIHTARQLMLDITALGLPMATEALDPIMPQYLHDLITWSAIGARTTESQTHREIASGLSSLVGFKNGTDGSLSVAINALLSARHPHRFLGVDDDGRVAVIETTGNPYAHIVLRGGRSGPNYNADSIRRCEDALQAINASCKIVVDCSHANSDKDYHKQPAVFKNLIKQRLAGTQSIVGVMLESHLHAGRQDLNGDLSTLRFGVSITDACIDWATTELLLRNSAKQLRDHMTRLG